MKSFIILLLCLASLGAAGQCMPIKHRASTFTSKVHPRVYTKKGIFHRKKASHFYHSKRYQTATRKKLRKRVGKG